MIYKTVDGIYRPGIRPIICILHTVLHWCTRFWYPSQSTKDLCMQGWIHYFRWGYRFHPPLSFLSGSSDVWISHCKTCRLFGLLMTVQRDLIATVFRHLANGFEAFVFREPTTGLVYWFDPLELWSGLFVIHYSFHILHPRSVHLFNSF